MTEPLPGAEMSQEGILWQKGHRLGADLANS